jgi:hypothetical protein
VQNSRKISSWNKRDHAKGIHSAAADCLQIVADFSRREAEDRLQIVADSHERTEEG